METITEEYRVTFHYTVIIDAADIDAAEELAAEQLGNDLDEVEYRRYFVSNMAATVNKVGK
jgi:hypothetical protein